MSDMNDREARLDDASVLIQGAIQALVAAMHDGAKHAARTWAEQPYGMHLNHLQAHVFALTAGREDEDHLTHIICRAVMAYVKRNGKRS